ncbi:hypothetical protein FEM48_Zijuj03G0179400 [Ziziphus jujuba var. spinosa]|uniref:Uncharacterized protein n=1 Tax=Ziziphus jujuba var. spinosa TaxID=714518 RepID=A0A978VRS6_ZIZJJ|nr:hypothetical protein FEM48_Zijuj03G0179400 [Ziziphus jujuba var. spinosa]
MSFEDRRRAHVNRYFGPDEVNKFTWRRAYRLEQLKEYDDVKSEMEYRMEFLQCQVQLHRLPPEEVERRIQEIQFDDDLEQLKAIPSLESFYQLA